MKISSIICDSKMSNAPAGNFAKGGHDDGVHMSKSSLAHLHLRFMNSISKTQVDMTELKSCQHFRWLKAGEYF